MSVVVGVSAHFDRDPPVLAEARTDERGLAEVSIPWSAVESVRGKPDSRLWTRVVSEGFQQRMAHVMLPGAPTSTGIEVLAISGLTARGRLIDPEGRGVQGMVRAVEPGSSTTTSIGLANSRANGSFELHLPREGTFDVLAEAETGTAAILGLEIRFAAASEPVDLHIRGPGIVRGHVRDSAGRPAGGLSVLIFLAELDDAEGSFVARDPEASVVAREGRGRSWVTTQTSVDGSFEARGLRADRFVVRARTSSQHYPHLLTPVSVQSDGTDLMLVLERPHIAVRVVDVQGATVVRPVQTSTNSWLVEPTALNLPESWPEEWVVLAVPVASEAHLGELGRPSLPPKQSGEEFVFEVVEGRSYQVGLIGGSQVWRPQEVLVDPGATRVEVTLTATANAPMGRISVSAFDPEGSPLFSNLSVLIADPTTGTPLVWREPLSDNPWPQKFELPEGDYRVVVEGAPTTDFFHGTLSVPAPWGRREVIVHVAAEKESVISAELPRGAKLHLVLKGTVVDADRDAIRRQFAGMNYELEYWANRAHLMLFPPQGWPQPAVFTMELTGSSAAGTHLTSELPLGSDSTSQLLPAGCFRLEARMPAGRVASKDIVLVDGATTDVSLDLGP
ncbi:MAG: carboxypeptidase-like regulatory domain-containing protein [Planctomycetota bacterium]